MVVRFKTPPETSKVEAPTQEGAGESTGYTILDALKDLQNKKEVLMLVHRDTGDSYRVLGYDSDTGLVTLEGSNKQRLKPRISARECQFYYPVWR